MARSRACLAEPPAESPSTINSLRALRRIVRAVRELTGQPQFAARGLARNVFFGAAAQPFLGPLDGPVEQLQRVRGRGGQPMIEGVAHDGFDDARRFRRHQPALVLALKLRFADEHRDDRGAGGHHVFAGDRRRALGLADPLGVILEAAQQRRAQARLMRAAVRGRDGVAIGMDEAVVVG